MFSGWKKLKMVYANRIKTGIDEEQRVLTLPNEIWNLIMTYCVGVAPQQHPYSKRASIRVFKRIFSLTSKSCCSLAQSLLPKEQPNDIRFGCVTTYCGSNGFESLLKYAIEHDRAIQKLTFTETARFGHLGCLKILVEQHSYSGHGNNWKQDALNEALKNGHINVAKYLLDQGAQLTEKMVEPAVLGGCIELVQLLQSLNLVKSFSHLGPYAAQSRNLEMVKFVEQHGAVLDSNCIINTAKGGSIEILQYLLDKGFEWPNHRVVPTAYYYKHKDYVRYAINRGLPLGGGLTHAIIDAKDWDMLKELGDKCPWNGYSIEIASANNMLELLKQLTINIENVPEEDRDFDLGYGVEFAAAYGHFDVVKYLVEKGAPKKDNVIGPIPIMQYLREQGYPWTVVTTATAADKGDLEILRYLHENGCPWDESTCDNAISQDSVECLQYALDNGCPWSSETMYKAESLRVLQILVEKGVPWNNDTCQTLIESGQLDMLKYAHENGAPWPLESIRSIFAERQTKDVYLCVAYAVRNGCPWNPQVASQEALDDGNTDEWDEL